MRRVEDPEAELDEMWSFATLSSNNGGFGRQL
jgi:hypothetical protein